MTNPDDILSRVAATARESGGRSKLLLWMQANRATFAALVEDNRPSWSALAEAFAKEGFTAPDGKPLRPESVRHIWYRARTAKKSRRAVAAAPVAPVAPVVVERRVKMPPPAGPNTDPLASIRKQAEERSGRGKS